METVLYICLIILYLWLACPSKAKLTVGNQPKKGFKLIEIPIVQLVYKEQTTVDYSGLTVVQLRKIAQSQHIKGARSLRKAQLLEALTQY
jgi:hypothetical protein